MRRPVYNNGYNIYFKGNGNNVTFSDSATIIMEGGTFQTDSASHGPQTTKNIFQAPRSHSWNGLKFTDCNVKIYNSKFQDISSPSGGNFALTFLDCPLNDIRYNTFINSTDTAGGVSVNYVNYSSSLSGYHCYIMLNTFTMNNSFSNAVQVQGFGGLTTGVYVSRNTMTSNGNATGIFLSTITGGVIKNNDISGFSIGVNTLLSSADMYGNSIENTESESRGILAGDLSSINLAPTSSTPVWTGGFNYLTNTEGSSKNIDIDNSQFTLWNGYNTLDLSSDTLSYHLSGFYWDGDYIVKIENNCYKLAGTTLNPYSPYLNVNDYYSNPVNYNYSPYLCDGTTPEGTDIADIGNGLYDTIATGSGGQGGGESSVLTLTNPRQIYDSIKIALRHRNYSNVKSLCLSLISSYPDSMQSIASLQVLFSTSISTDTSYSAINDLKTYYESLILNHSGNGALVKISGYLVLKCKVLLRQYTSALTGFEEIINNSPYSYEGLLARWDYMATSLLIQGQGGGESSEDDDKNPFTKEERKQIKESVIKAFETSRDKEQKKIEELNRQSKEGNENSKRELNRKMILKYIIKTERPKSFTEHLRIVNNDIHKVYVNDKVSLTKPQSLIPTSYNLYQNYPNPFNPISTIKYDLPNDVKVVIKIYDILGREVSTLVNEFKKAGRYTSQFDGTNLASGVYFYRIEAGDGSTGSPRGFVQSKKMVLVK